MKTIKWVFVGIFVLIVLMCISCVKQKNCEGCIEGKWIYLESPYTDMNGTKKIVAHFYPDSSDGIEMKFGGKIPKKFQSTDTMRVCLNYNEPRFYTGYCIYDLTCIEKITSK